MHATNPVQRTVRTTQRRSDEEMEVVRARRGKLNKTQRQSKRDIWQEAE
ncbi:MULTISPECIES: hypothetical protein [Pseudomonas]|uniref:Uncharacterized protein n=1 Tax=Pseudomonas rubra TaxID=2942627 RepID=A0ABT5P6F7_9PSED|nr:MULTISPECIES: hypothetical protein [Pseudomonas]MDD1013876.1 hypothetical protein [Pseudomonas rubra]MDD1038303.1 hypothetical protein [Pseudomonas rubra]MDD1154607.1 hypothetical protein [Pseudomonas rubra]DAF68361.1 MAG TPA: hypothetical protein [Caudoviricetes sp.]